MNPKAPRRPPPPRPMGMMGVLQGRVRMKHVAVVETDPVQFAKKLNEVTNELIDEGFNISGMMERGGGIVVSSVKIEPFQAPMSSPVPSVPNVITYYFVDQQEEGIQSLSFPSISEALSLVRKHLAVPERFSPGTVALTFVTTYDPSSDMHLLEKLAAEA